MEASIPNIRSSNYPWVFRLDTQAMIPILYQDEDYVIVDKPSGLLVHPNPLNRSPSTCLNLLRDQIGKYLFPVHRLDRSASGVLCFALSSEAARSWKAQSAEGLLKKTYLIAVRGFTEDAGEITKPLKTANGESRAAITHFRTLQKIELPIPVGRYATSRYSLARVEIETGRFHQIRKHFDSSAHPVLGDTWYGDGKHNQSLRANFILNRLLLFAESMEFENSFSGKKVQARIGFPAELERLGFKN
jgi:tRNA pseudouridine65 synthase